MSNKGFIAAILIGGLLVAIAWQRGVLAGQRSRNESLRAAQEEAARLALASPLENSGLPNPAATEANRSPAVEVSPELLRLRNEARQLRAQKLERDRLKGQNERLATAIQSGAVPPEKFAELEGFVAKESWSNAGFATPESALETFFWAAREGDLARVAECMPANERQYVAALTQPGREQERDGMVADLRRMTQGIGFRVVEKAIQEEGFITGGGPPVGGEPRVATKVLLRIQAVVGGSIIPVSLRLDADGWKIKDF